jgi:phosphoglycolate phosphatase-like HAD superfamily hydrolase
MARTEQPLRLILWDIDHTLIETCGTGSQYARAAFQEITGQPQRHHPNITGKTEAAIIAETLRLHGIEPSDDEYLRRYAEALAHQYAQYADQLATQGRALPGARDTLAALAQHPDLIQAVLTGNFRQVAAIKLDVFHLT